MAMRVVNLERGLPSVDQARSRLKQALASAKRDRVAVLKIIHGYGSSGIGGALRSAIRQSLKLRRKEGLISAVIFGEHWSIFDQQTRDVLEAHPSLARDADLDRLNEGVVIVVFES